MTTTEFTFVAPRFPDSPVATASSHSTLHDKQSLSKGELLRVELLNSAQRKCSQIAHTTRVIQG